MTEPNVEVSPAVVHNALASVLTPQAVKPAQVEAPAAQAVAPVVAAQQLVTEVAPQVLAPVTAVKADETPAPKGDWIDNLVAPVAPAAPAVIDDAFKGAFKQHFGHEDPLAYKAKVDQEQAELALLKPRAEQGEVLRQFIDNVPPAFAQALAILKEGKDPIAYLRSLPDAVIQDKAAKDLTPRQLTDTYTPGKISKEDWDKLVDPDIDDSVKEAIKDKIKIYSDIASDKHEDTRSAGRKDIEAREVAQRAAQEAYTKQIAANAAHVKQSPVASLADQNTIDEFANGKLLRKFMYQEDGVTLRHDLLEKLLFAENRNAVIDKFQKAILARGKSEGLLEATARIPSGPVGGGREVTEATKGTVSVEQQILQKVARSA